jgi:hypothetical protein
LGIACSAVVDTPTPGVENYERSSNDVAENRLMRMAIDI